MSNEVFEYVQAVLLNSECPPKDAVKQAMLALLQFAITEADMGVLEFDGVASQAWTDGREAGLW